MWGWWYNPNHWAWASWDFNKFSKDIFYVIWRVLIGNNFRLWNRQEILCSFPIVIREVIKKVGINILNFLFKIIESINLIFVKSLEVTNCPRRVVFLCFEIFDCLISHLYQVGELYFHIRGISLIFSSLCPIYWLWIAILLRIWRAEISSSTYQ